MMKFDVNLRILAIVLFISGLAVEEKHLYAQTNEQGSPADVKTPVPNQESLASATKLMRELYGAQIDAAITPERQQKEAAFFVNKARTVADDHASCYVLLHEAGTLFFKARDYAGACDVVDEMATIFNIDGLELKRKIVLASSSDEKAAYSRCCCALQMMSAYETAQQPERALEMAKVAEDSAKQWRGDASKEVVEIKGHAASLKLAVDERDMEKEWHSHLEASPNDPATNLAAGRFYCFKKHDWERGLPLLALGNEANLKEIATQELTKPTDVERENRVADAWWNLAQHADESSAGAMFERAGFWYNLALNHLSGLQKEKVATRLAEIPGKLRVYAANNIAPTRLLSGYESRQSLLCRVTGGGNAESQKAATAALNWLAHHQMSDGSWSLHNYVKRCVDKSCDSNGSKDADAGATALGLLPFLAAGHTHKTKGQYMAVVSGAVKWLIKRQKPNGDLSSGASPKMYSHGLATMALCEAYGMTGDKAVGQAAQGGVNFIVATQNRNDGGWRYNPGDAGDTSVVGWEFMALKSARLAGIDVSGAAFSGASKWLDLANVANGAQYCYQPGNGSTPPMTAIGLLCREYLGAKRDNPMLVQGTSYLSNHLPDEDKKNIYYWYYASQVFHNIGGAQWQNWNHTMRALLIRMQNRDPDKCAFGSWDPAKDAWGAKYGGRLYQTSLSALTLEVYYRYPPLYIDVP